MKHLRLVLVTRRFWPLVGGAETVMANLAGELARQGNQVTILTARWDRHWTGQTVYRDVPVVRLVNPRLRFWGTLRYMLTLRHWLRGHHDQMDLVYVSMLKHDACVVAGELARSSVPVVLRAEGAGPRGDCCWQQQANFGRRIRTSCLAADAFVAPSESIEAELSGAGYPESRIHRIANGVPQYESQNRQQPASKSTRAGVCPGLASGQDSQLVVFAGRLDLRKGLADLIDAWPRVLSQVPRARLILAGDGPDRPHVVEHIERLQLETSVLLPGVFDSMEDLLGASDAFVLPSYEEGMSMALLEAMAAGLPVVATDIAGNRAVVRDGHEGLLVPVREPARLAQAIGRVLEDAHLAGQLGRAAQQRVCQEFSIARMTAEHQQLFEQLVADKAGRV